MVRTSSYKLVFSTSVYQNEQINTNEMADSAINNNVNGIESPEKIVKCNQIRVVCAENGEIRRTLVQTAYSHYPVRIIPVESWKLHVTVNILGFGGGIISGDRVMFDIKVENAATLLYENVISIMSLLRVLLLSNIQKCRLRTQGNTKVFKAVEDNFCNQSMTLEVHDDALLVFAPDFTSCFEGADFRQQTQLKCSKSGSMIFMDWYSSGRQVTLLTIFSPYIDSLFSINWCRVVINFGVRRKFKLYLAF